VGGVTRQRLGLALLIAAAAVAAVALNLVLLTRAGAQPSPVGRLIPGENVPAAPQWTIRPTTGPASQEHKREHADD
jgi:hypothetical protein